MRYSLRTLLLLMTVVCVSLALIGNFGGAGAAFLGLPFTAVLWDWFLERRVRLANEARQ
jgi:hypothetical protein